MKLSTRAIMGLVNALSLFEQQDTRAGPPGTEKKPYKLGTGARMTMAKNLARLSEISTAYQKERNNRILVHGDGGNSVKPENAAAFTYDDTMLLDWLHDVDLSAIKEDDLKLDQNDIPLIVIAGLGPMIEGMPEPMKATFPKIPKRAANGAAQEEQEASQCPA